MQIGAISIQNDSLTPIQIKSIGEVIQKITFKQPNLIGLSTCFRHEIYFSHDQLDLHVKILLLKIEEELHSSFQYQLYLGDKCFEHLSKLMAGLDSPILGETHVLNQVKKAYIEEIGNKAISSELHFLFQKSLKLAKSLRYSQSAILGKESLEKKVCEKVLLKAGINDPILLVGNSDINRIIFNMLITLGFNSIFFASKSDIQFYHKKLKGCLSYEILKKWDQFTAVIIATYSKELLIVPKIEVIQTKLVIDLSMPKVTKDFSTDSIDYYDLDKITALIQENQAYLKDWKALQEKKIQTQVERQIALFYLRQLKKKQLANR